MRTIDAPPLAIAQALICELRWRGIVGRQARLTRRFMFELVLRLQQDSMVENGLR
jgi:hypothetical protein